MTSNGHGEISAAFIEDLYRAQSRQVLATLIRLLGDFDLAEEALQDAFAAAAVQWPREGVPANPRAWLVSAGRFKVIDRLRQRARQNEALPELLIRSENALQAAVDADVEDIVDDRMRLIFTCCHPALAPDAQVSLTLREICGLTTEAIADAFLVRPPTIGQRIVRAKARIRELRLPYAPPEPEEWDARLEIVLRVIYLIFTQGYANLRSGDGDLCEEAIRLGWLLTGMIDDGEVTGLLALMLLQHSRRAARWTPEGELILLEDQDRSRWDRRQIEEGVRLTRSAMERQPVGGYTLQAAIAALHAEAASAEATDWRGVAGLYDLLLQADPSPVVELNRAVALAMRDGPSIGLALLNDIAQRGELADYHLFHAARADFLRRLGDRDGAREAYGKALNLARIDAEQRFLKRRLRELG